MWVSFDWMIKRIQNWHNTSFISRFIYGNAFIFGPFFSSAMFLSWTKLFFGFVLLPSKIILRLLSFSVIFLSLVFSFFCSLMCLPLSQNYLSRFYSESCEKFRWNEILIKFIKAAYFIYIFLVSVWIKILTAFFSFYIFSRDEKQKWRKQIISVSFDEFRWTKKKYMKLNVDLFCSLS